MSVPQFVLILVVSSPLNWVIIFSFQAFLDDYCATAAESLLKHVLLRAKGRVALRRLGSSKASSHNNRAHHDHLGDETSSMSSSISCKIKGGDEDKDEDQKDIGPKSTAESPLASDDTSSDNSYDDEDDAFDDSDTDDDTDQASSTDTTTPATASTISPTVESPSAPAVLSISSMTRNSDDSTASTATPSGPSLSGDVPNAGPRQQQEQQQQQQLQQQASAVPTTPSPAHTGTATTPRTSPLRSVGMTSEKGGISRDGGVPTEEQDRVAYPTGDSGKSGDGDEVGKLRKHAMPVSARR